MKRIILAAALSALAAMAIVSCDDEETYAEQKAREAKNINEFISDRGIDVISLDEFLVDTVTNNPETGPDFTKNEYVLFSDKGVYMQIVRRGKGRVLESGERWNMNARYIELYVSTGDTMTMNLFQDVADKLYVKRAGDSYTSAFTSGIMLESYGSTMLNSWLMPMPYIKPGFLNGDASAKVRLIVPHNEGTQSAASNVYPAYYEITFTTEKWQ